MSPRPRAVVLLSAALPALLAVAGCFEPSPQPQGTAGRGEYLFCFWNVENLFDDKLDPGRPRPDKPYDEWFAENDHDRRLKYEHLREALLKMNDGRGPDVLAVAEVESERAAELLQKELNDHLADPALHYTHVLMKEVKGGRHIAPAILTRLPVEGNRTRLLDKPLRILEGHVTVNDHDLVVIASHWTSRVSSHEDEPGKARDKYADEIYGHVRGMYLSNPKVDVLVCGDFNDTPEDESVTKHLRATGDRAAVLRSDAPLLLDLMADKGPRKEGTLYHDGKWSVFDQFVVSPGMLDDEGWGYVPDSARVVNDLTADKKGRPWRFGNKSDKHERGYSDHFPVTVKLKVR